MIFHPLNLTRKYVVLDFSYNCDFCKSWKKQNPLCTLQRVKNEYREKLSVFFLMLFSMSFLFIQTENEENTMRNLSELLGVLICAA